MGLVEAGRRAWWRISRCAPGCGVGKLAEGRKEKPREEGGLGLGSILISTSGQRQHVHLWVVSRLGVGDGGMWYGPWTMVNVGGGARVDDLGSATV